MVARFFMFKIKRKYSYVVNCPRCNSPSTGFILSLPSKKAAENAIYKGLLNGEIIDPIINFLGEIPERNLFCTKCGARWSGEVQTKFITKDEIEEEKDKRGIDFSLIQSYYDNAINNRMAKKINKMINKRKNKHIVKKDDSKSETKEVKKIRIKK